MRIVIAGGHGKIALLLSRQLQAAGHDPVGLIRNADHAAEVEAAGARPVVIDLESAGVDELAGHLDGADAVVFSAGGGANSGAARKLTVDRDGAILLADAAERAGVSRYVLVSAIHTDDFDAARAVVGSPEEDVFQVYLRAKSEADAAIRARDDLDWTIVRPGTLTDDPALGTVAVGSRLENGPIPRADVAAVVATAIIEGTAVRTQFELTGGEHEISDALAAIRY